MKYFKVLFLTCIAWSAHGQPTLVRLWESDTITFPESVLCTSDMLYVSLLDHYPLREQGKGKIVKVGLDGKIIDGEWIVGLDGPKGMVINNKKLYVADINQIVVIDIKNGKIDYRIPVPGATGLNDLTIDHDGILYTSDPEQGLLYWVVNGKPEIYLSELPGINGLATFGKDLYLVASSGVYRVDSGKKLSALSKFYEGADGIASLGQGFLVTVYNGLIYYVNKAGKLQLVLDTQAEKIGSADIEYDSKKGIVYVPTLYRNSIIAYQLK